MATGITPFGESFADPRRYMSQSPMAQIGQALKSYGMIQGLEKSGAIKALDNLGIKADNRGNFTFNKPAGAVPPITSGAAGDMNTNGVWGSNPMPVSPSSLSQPVMPVAPVPPATPMGAGVQITPMGQEAPSNVQFNTLPPPPPPDAGMQLLNGTFRPQSAIDVKNETDFNPLSPDTSNQFAVSGNDYLQVPGYGSLKEKMGKLSMLMGMG
jgi:hypothetical protein